MIIRKINKIFTYIFKSRNLMDLTEYEYSSSVYTKNKGKQSTKSTKDQQNSKNSKKVRVKPLPNKDNKSLKPKITLTLQKILQWRSKNVAVVDTMGCQRLADLKAPIQVQKYQTLIALMLSIQTKDETTSMCVKRLQQYGLTPQKISNIQQQKLVTLIYQSNFNKRKAKNIIQVSKLILANGLAKNKEDMMKYPGVGVKITTIYMNVAQDKQQGIGVDTHVHRITNKLGWVSTDSPNDTESRLQQIVPKQYWKDINIALVGFGQLICQAKTPLCNKCPVSDLCPSSSIKW